LGNLESLSRMIHARNEIDQEICRIIGRPAERGHVGEYIASRPHRSEGIPFIVMRNHEASEILSERGIS
jgi:hypothetical protein